MNASATQPPLATDLDGWLHRFRDAPIPVLAETAEVLDALADNQDAVDAHALADSLCADPLLTVRLLAHVGTHCRRITDVETITGALVLMGIGPFFSAFSGLPAVEDTLASQPEALAGLHSVITRARRSANFALGMAVHRMDHDAAVIQEAALLHDFAEMLLWCHAPAPALEIARRQQADPALRSAQAQRDVLGIELPDLQHTLMQAWHLPQLLIQLGDDRHADSGPVKNVLLAVQLARHTASGWDNPAVPDDVAAIAELLRQTPESTLELLRDLDT